MSAEPDLGEQQAGCPACFPRNGDIVSSQVLGPVFGPILAQRRFLRLFPWF